MEDARMVDTADARMVDTAEGDIDMATNFANATYQEIYDIQTVAKEVSIFGIHTPTGPKPRKMLAGFFMQFRKFKYLGCDVVMVPAAKLPADPLGLSIEAGQNNADMRDLVNPILFHGCHGDNLNSALNQIYSDSATVSGTSLQKYENDFEAVPLGNTLDWESQYYRAMSDPTFRKCSTMQSLRLKGLHPLVYNVVSNMQISPIEGHENIGSILTMGDSVTPAGSKGFDPSTYGVVADDENIALPIAPRLSTSRLQSLGWLDTYSVVNRNKGSGGVVPADTVLPKLFMGLLILPPCYLTKMYFRLVITHRFAFKQFNTSLTHEGAFDYYDFVDHPADGVVAAVAPVENSIEAINGNISTVSDGVY